MVCSYSSEGKWTRLSRLANIWANKRRPAHDQFSPPSSVTEIYETDECQDHLYSSFLLFYHLKSVFTSGKLEFRWSWHQLDSLKIIHFDKTQKGRHNKWLNSTSALDFLSPFISKILNLKFEKKKSKHKNWIIFIEMEISYPLYHISVPCETCLDSEADQTRLLPD